MTAKNKIRRGFSMVELLIVVAVSMMLIAIAIPFVTPALRQSKIREASRLVNTFIAGARSRAAESGRPFGIRLLRSSLDDNGDANDCYRLRYVEVPPYYSGDVEGALISVGPGAGGLSFMASVPNGDPANFRLANVPYEAFDEIHPRFVDIGDLIRFSYAGPWYRIDNIAGPMAGHSGPNDTVLTLSVLQDPTSNTSGVGFQNWPVNPGLPASNSPFSQAQRLPYQIMRRPMPSSSLTVEMPRDTSIDLSISGFGVGGAQFRTTSAVDNDSIDIIFDAGGKVQFLAVGAAIRPAPQETIYLMVGEASQVWPAGGIVKAHGVPANVGQPAIFPHDPDDFLGNIASNDVYWIAIHRATGNVITAENVGSPTNYLLDSGGNPVTNAHDYPIPDFSLAREIVRSGIAKGSR